jgi:hypothetical protein
MEEIIKDYACRLTAALDVSSISKKISHLGQALLSAWESTYTIHVCGNGGVRLMQCISLMT